MIARLLTLAYQLRQHRVGGWTLDRWAVTLTWGAGVLIGTQWVLRGRPNLPAWHWAVLALLLSAGAGMLVLRGWAARRLYSAFSRQPGLEAPASAPMPPEDKIAVRATGTFEVQGRFGLFAGLEAYWRTYASREHTVLAIQHQTRFLLGRSRAEDVGMWYMFIPAAAITEVAPGRLHSGSELAPALRVDYRRQPPALGGKRPPRESNETVYLAFTDDAAREQVWADLVADRG